MKIHDYKYVAKDLSSGKIYKGTTEAPSKVIVDKYLLERGLRAMQIEEIKSILGSLSRITIGKVIKDRDLIFYLKQLGSLLNTGINLNESLEILATQQENKLVRRVYYGIYYEVNSGSSFSDALKNYPKEFPRLLVSMIAIGEATGDLGPIITELSSYFENQFRIKSSIRSTMMMPIIYILMAFGVSIFVLTTVLPNFTEIFESSGAKLPAITRIFIAFGDIVKKYGIIAISVVTVITAVYIFLKKSNQNFARFISKVAIKIPIFGELVILGNLSRIASSLAQLMTRHIPLQDALVITKDTLSNHIYIDLMSEANKRVKSGEYMSSVFNNHYAIEIVFSKMISIGEKSGELPAMMKSLSRFYDEDAEIKVERLKKSLEPLVLAFIYMFVIIMILAVLLPSMTLSDSIH